MLMMHGQDVSTTLRATPCHVFADESLVYAAEFRVFGQNPLEPIYVKKSPPMNLTDVFELTSEEVEDATGLTDMLLYVEEYSRVTGHPPSSAIMTLNSQAHYYSENGRVHGHLGSFFIYGAPRKMLKGDFYYENFPGVSFEQGAEFIVYVLNPFTRVAEYSVLLVDREGVLYESESFHVAGKGAAVWSSKNRPLGHLVSPCGAILRSSMKLPCFFAARSKDGRMFSMDHGHAFLSQVLKH